MQNVKHTYFYITKMHIYILINAIKLKFIHTTICLYLFSQVLIFLVTRCQGTRPIESGSKCNLNLQETTPKTLWALKMGYVIFN